ncbi:MAG: hypothetical protein ACI920_002964, partial [Saprospiraceae bacterium]
KTILRKYLYPQILIHGNAELKISLFTEIIIS